MKNKKILYMLILLINLSWTVFSSCSKEDSKPLAPTVELIHLGTHESPDDRILVIGEGAHLEANITAPGLVEKIELDFYQKSGYGTYHFSEVYTDDYVGLNEVEGFHSHPTLPEETPVGDYLFRLTVTDQLGQTGIIEADVTVKAAEEGGGHVHEE